VLKPEDLQRLRAYSGSRYLALSQDQRDRFRANLYLLLVSLSSDAYAVLRCSELSPGIRHSSTFSRDGPLTSEEDVMRANTPLKQTETGKSIRDRKEHARAAVRLRYLTAAVTTPAAKARIFAQIQEHTRLGGLSENGEMLDWR